MPSAEQLEPEEIALLSAPPASLQRLTGFVRGVKQRTRRLESGAGRTSSGAAMGATARSAQAFAQQIVGTNSLLSRLRHGGSGGGRGGNDLADRAPHRVYTYRFRSPNEAEPPAFEAPGSRSRRRVPPLPGRVPPLPGRVPPLPGRVPPSLFFRQSSPAPVPPSPSVKSMSVQRFAALRPAPSLVFRLGPAFRPTSAGPAQASSVSPAQATSVSPAQATSVSTAQATSADSAPPPLLSLHRSRAALLPVAFSLAGSPRQSAQAPPPDFLANVSHPISAARSLFGKPSSRTIPLPGRVPSSVFGRHRPLSLVRAFPLMRAGTLQRPIALRPALPIIPLVAPAGAHLAGRTSAPPLLSLRRRPRAAVPPVPFGVGPAFPFAGVLRQIAQAGLSGLLTPASLPAVTAQLKPAPSYVPRLTLLPRPPFSLQRKTSAEVAPAHAPIRRRLLLSSPALFAGRSAEAIGWGGVRPLLSLRKRPVPTAEPPLSVSVLRQALSAPFPMQAQRQDAPSPPILGELKGRGLERSVSAPSAIDSTPAPNFSVLPGSKSAQALGVASAVFATPLELPPLGQAVSARHHAAPPPAPGTMLSALTTAAQRLTGPRPSLPGNVRGSSMVPSLPLSRHPVRKSRVQSPLVQRLPLRASVLSRHMVGPAQAAFRIAFRPLVSLAGSYLPVSAVPALPLTLASRRNRFLPPASAAAQPTAAQTTTATPSRGLVKPPGAAFLASAFAAPSQAEVPSRVSATVPLQPAPPAFVTPPLTRRLLPSPVLRLSSSVTQTYQSLPVQRAPLRLAAPPFRLQTVSQAALASARGAAKTGLLTASASTPARSFAARSFARQPVPPPRLLLRPARSTEPMPAAAMSSFTGFLTRASVSKLPGRPQPLGTQPLGAQPLDGFIQRHLSLPVLRLPLRPAALLLPQAAHPAGSVQGLSTPVPGRAIRLAAFPALAEGRPLLNSPVLPLTLPRLNRSASAWPQPAALSARMLGAKTPSAERPVPSSHFSAATPVASLSAEARPSVPFRLRSLLLPRLPLPHLPLPLLGTRLANPASTGPIPRRMSASAATSEMLGRVPVLGGQYLPLPLRSVPRPALPGMASRVSRSAGHKLVSFGVGVARPLTASAPRVPRPLTLRPALLIPFAAGNFPLGVARHSAPLAAFSASANLGDALPVLSETRPGHVPGGFGSSRLLPLLQRQAAPAAQEQISKRTFASTLGTAAPQNLLTPRLISPIAVQRQASPASARSVTALAAPLVMTARRLGTLRAAAAGKPATGSQRPAFAIQKPTYGPSLTSNFRKSGVGAPLAAPFHSAMPFQPSTRFHSAAPLFLSRPQVEAGRTSARSGGRILEAHAQTEPVWQGHRPAAFETTRPADWPLMRRPIVSSAGLAKREGVPPAPNTGGAIWSRLSPPAPPLLGAAGTFGGPALQRALACPALTLTKRRLATPADDGGTTIQRQAEPSPLPVLTASTVNGGLSGLQVIQRKADAAAAEAVSAPDAEGGKAGTPEAGQDVNLLAHEVWSILKARIGYEAERMGRR